MLYSPTWIQNRRSTEADLHSSSHYTQANSTIWMLNTVEPLYNGHLGGRRNWAFQRGWNGSECTNCQPKKNGRCREVTVVKRWPLIEVWPYQELLALTKHCNEGDPLRRNTPAKGVKKLQTPTLLGWFSNRTETSVDDGACKLNNWLDQWQSGKLGTGSRVQSFPRAFPSSSDVPVLLLNQPIMSRKTK